jgi:RNA polymerase sigma factor (sigma-70 family)
MTAHAALRGDEADLFAQHHQRLLRSVKRAVNAPDALIEDACQLAWTLLIRNQPDRGPRLLGWLRTVAIHEAYRLSRTQRRDLALEDLALDGTGGSSPDGWEALIEGPTDLDSQLAAKHALSVLASLPERQRCYLALLIAGYSYQEIVELAGVTYTNVNKHLARARESVRAAKETA